MTDDEIHERHALRDECLLCREPWPCWLNRQIEQAKDQLAALPPKLRRDVKDTVRAITRGVND